MSAKEKLKNAEIDKELIQDVVNNIEYNKIIINYYKRFSKESSVVFSSQLLENKSKSIQFCNKYWQLDKYEKSKVKDFQKTNLCHDKFCSNCKKVKQASRMAKYIPSLEPYKEHMYHMVLTVPNVSADDLRFTIKHMSKCFTALIRILDGRRKIKGLDFSGCNFRGCVRSLEVTFKKNSYHPHFHVGIIFENFIMTDKEYINCFSYHNRGSIKELKRLFSLEEIIIQKIWYLLINKITVNRKNIDSLNVGYSCMIDKFNDDDYAELFKYMTKATNEDGFTLTYDNFVSLFYALYRVKQIQGYGVLYNITDDGDLESLENKYLEFIEELKKAESPTVSYEKPSDLLKDNEYLLISRKSYFKYLNTL